MAAIRFAHAQVVDLRMTLDANLVRAVWGDINRAYWSVMGRLDEKTLAMLDLSIDSAFDTHIRRWQNVESVRTLLERACEILKEAAWIALDVPWPGDPTVEHHIAAVRHNLMDFFDIKYFSKIRKAMLDVSPSVLKIQRAWRRCHYDPSHPVCRRRLLREFETLSTDLETLTV